MDYIEVSGKNVDEALTNALIKLETTSDKVEYEVIERKKTSRLRQMSRQKKQKHRK